MSKFIIKNLQNNFLFVEQHKTVKNRILKYCFRKRDRANKNTKLFLYFYDSEIKKYSCLMLTNYHNGISEFRIMNKNNIITDSLDGKQYIINKINNERRGWCSNIGGSSFGRFTDCESGTCNHAICQQNLYNQDYYD